MSFGVWAGRHGRHLLPTLALVLSVMTLSGCRSAGQREASPIGPGRSGEVAAERTGATVGATASDSGEPAILVAAGDIASCNSAGDEATATLVEAIPGTIAALGDIAYERGTAEEFARCYEPTWGRFKDRTRPAIGNHEYYSADATPYFASFGAAAGSRPGGYYSYDLGGWHVIVLNSNCEFIGCGSGSEQERWLRADLAAHPAPCTLAYWHHPRFSSGIHGSDASVRSWWRALYDAGAEIVLSGHDHSYERFAPQDPSGSLDRERGIREFVVGTGGRDLYQFSGTPVANSEVRDASTFGVLKLSLYPDRYEWEFIPTAGGSSGDRGVGTCH